MERWSQIYRDVLEHLVKSGVDRDAAEKAQGGFADAWDYATQLKLAVESLAAGKDPEAAVSNTLYRLGFLDETMTRLIEGAAHAYRFIYGPWDSRTEQIDRIEYTFEESRWLASGGEEALATAMVGVRMRARRMSDMLSQLGLTGLDTDYTPRAALKKVTKQLDALDRSTAALREAIASAAPRRTKTYHRAKAK